MRFRIGKSKHPAPRTMSLDFLIENLESRKMLAAELMHSLFPGADDLQPRTEQGFSVAANSLYYVAGKPGASDSFQSSGSVEIYDAATNQHLTTISNPTPGAGDRFGEAVALVGSTLAISAPENDGSVFGIGSVHLFDISGSPTLIATIDNPDAESFVNFGGSIALSSSTLAIGSSEAESGGEDAGKVFVYDLTGASPTLSATIDNPTPESNDEFGLSVALDGTTLVVGAPGEDLGIPFSSGIGIAYVYDVSAGSNLITTINNPTGLEDELFGSAVAIDGSTIAIGARSDDGDGNAYVFELSGGTATLLDTINNPTPADGGFFGGSVALSGTTLAVGHISDSSVFSNDTVSVYDLSTGTAQLTETLNNPTPFERDLFGASLTIVGDNVLVGTPGDNALVWEGGSVIVYDLTVGGSAVATLANPTTPSSDDGFGDSVDIDGSIMVVGSNGFDSVFRDTGRVHIYDISGPTEVLLDIVDNPSPVDTVARFGSVVSISGSIVAVAATGEDTVYIYDVSSGSAQLLDTIVNPNPGDANEDGFGWDVEVEGNLIVIGSLNGDTIEEDTGSAFLYDISSGSAVLVDTLDHSSPEDRDRFGEAVAISGSTVLVGAPNDNANAGSVHIYDISSGSAVLTDVINSILPAQSFRGLGRDLAIDGTTAAIASSSDNGVFNTGNVYLYEINSGVATLQDTIFNTGVSNTLFGRRLDIEGNSLVFSEIRNDA
ncbi:MAG: hypothetical protein AAF497_18280, partial [Planctomycetota bacterium]